MLAFSASTFGELSQAAIATNGRTSINAFIGFPLYSAGAEGREARPSPYGSDAALQWRRPGLRVHWLLSTHCGRALGSSSAPLFAFRLRFSWQSATYGGAGLSQTIRRPGVN
jgi:hypothetical protein